MTLTELLLSQLTDVFRIGLVIALVATALRNRAVTGMAIPLAAGILFIAVIIPATLPGTEPMMRAVGVGMMANLILVALAVAVWQIVGRLRR
jgi:uncharacterized membrane protein (GlpM family)